MVFFTAPVLRAMLPELLLHNSILSLLILFFGVRALPGQNAAREPAWADEARVAMENADYKKVIDITSLAIKRNPKDALAYSCRGFAYKVLNKPEAAITDLSNAIRLNPAVAGDFLNRGTAYSSLKQYEKAIMDFDRALELDRNMAPAHTNRGGALIEQGHYEKGVAACSRAIALNPQDAVAYKNRSLGLSKIKKHQQALDDVVKAVELVPNDWYALHLLAEQYLNSGEKQLRDVKRAITCAEKASKASHAKEVRCELLLASSYARDGQFAEAAKVQERAIRLYLKEEVKERADAESTLSYYQKGKLPPSK